MPGCYRAQFVGNLDNTEVARAPHRPARSLAHAPRRARRACVDLARGRGGAATVRVRPRPPVRRRAASRHRHRRGARGADPGAGCGNDLVRGDGPERRPDPHDPHARRLRRDAAPPRFARSRPRRVGCGGRDGRHGGSRWPRVSRRPPRLRPAGLRRPPRIPAGQSRPADHSARPGTRACCRRPGSGSGCCSGSRAGRRAGARAGTRTGARPDRRLGADRRRSPTGVATRGGRLASGGASGCKPRRRSGAGRRGSCGSAGRACLDACRPRPRVSGCAARRPCTGGITGRAASRRPAPERRSAAPRAGPTPLPPGRAFGDSSPGNRSGVGSAGAHALGNHSARAGAGDQRTRAGDRCRRRPRRGRAAVGASPCSRGQATLREPARGRRSVSHAGSCRSRATPRFPTCAAAPTAGATTAGRGSVRAPCAARHPPPACALDAARGGARAPGQRLSGTEAPLWRAGGAAYH